MQDVGGFRVAVAGEETALDHLRVSLVDLRQSVQCVTELGQLIRGVVRKRVGTCKMLDLAE